MTAIHFKKALQPDHPSAKTCDAISPPPCEHGIPLYPLRYGIAEQAYDPSVFNTLNVNGYPTLQGDKTYGLRVLRPGSYVYLFYFQHGRMKTRHYLVTEDIRFAHVWWTDEDYNEQAPGRLARPDMNRAVPYLLAPDTSIAKTVYVMVSETILTHATLWKIEQDTDNLRTQLATAVEPASGPEQRHAFEAVLLGLTTKELLRPGISGQSRHYPWSEITLPKEMGDQAHILRHLHQRLFPRTEIKPLAVVLQDPLGIASELHHLVTEAVRKKTQFAGENAHKLQSAASITNYFKAAEQGAAASSETASTLRKQRSLVNYAGASAFPELYAKEIAAFDAIIDVKVKDVIAWAYLIVPMKPLGKALGCFDLSNRLNARDYETAVFECIAGLVHNLEGQQLLERVVMAPPAQSAFWLALTNGSSVLANRIQEKTGDIAKNLFHVLDNYFEEHAATPATNALISLLQALPSAKQADVLVRRLRHVMEIRFNATIVMYDLSVADLMRYAHEFQGHQSLSPEQLKSWKLPSPVVSQAQLKARVLIYDWVKIGETTYQELHHAPAERPALPPSRPAEIEGNLFSNTLQRLRAPLGYMFTGLGAYLSVNGLASAWKQAFSDDANTADMGSLLGAAINLIGAGIEITAITIAAGANIQNNRLLETRLKIFAARRGLATFVAGGAAIGGVADVLRSINAANNMNTAQAQMYLGSAISTGILALSSWGAGTAAAASLAGGSVVAVLGLTPPGWAIIALIALGINIGFIAGIDNAKHGPVDTWLKHSIWGIHGRRYNKKEELDAIHRLYHQPRLSADWEQKSGYSIGTLRIHCQLPGIIGDPKEHFQTKLNFTLHRKSLKKIEGPIIYSTSTGAINYEEECLIVSLGQTGLECGWLIQMHKETELRLEYLFIPNPNRPDLNFTQPDAPLPLTFKAGDLFNDPISPIQLEPLRPPQ